MKCGLHQLLYIMILTVILLDWLPEPQPEPDVVALSNYDSVSGTDSWGLTKNWYYGDDEDDCDGQNVHEHVSYDLWADQDCTICGIPHIHVFQSYFAIDIKVSL